MATRDFSKEQEERVAKKLGGSTVVGSGSTDFKKGDVTLDRFLVECKTKLKPSKSHAVQKAWYTKAKEQAFQMGKEDYIVAFDFGDGEDIYSTHERLFRDMLGCYEAVQEIVSLYGYEGDFMDSKELKDIKEIIRRNF